MMEFLYFVTYKSDDDSCPIYTGGKNYKDNEWTNDHEWRFNDPDPFKFEINSNYSLLIDEDFINLDFSDSTYVSELFLKTLDELEVTYRAIPLQVILKNDKKTHKKYFILLLKGRYFLLDKEKSEFEFARDLYTGEVISSIFDEKENEYDVIEKFYIKETKIPELFICAETLDLMCTQRFKDKAEEKQLLGLSFELVQDGFKYDEMNPF